MSVRFRARPIHTPRPKAGRRLRAGALAATLAGLGAMASAAPVTTLIAEDTFSYPGGAFITGRAGGTGWTSAWESDSSAFNDFSTNATSLVVPGVASSGGRMVFRQVSTQLNDAARNVPRQGSGVVFIQFLSQFGTQSGGGTPGVRLLDSGALTGGIGNNGGCSGQPVYAILNTGLQPIAASCSTTPLSALRAVVLRIDYTANNTRLWLLSDLTGFDYLQPPAPSAEYAGLAPAFDRIAIYSRNPASLDELRVFRVADPAATAQSVPGASVWTLLGMTALLAGAAAHVRWRRRASVRTP